MRATHTQGEWRIVLTRAGNLKIMCGAKEICSDRGLNPGNNLEYMPLGERESNFLLMAQAPMLLNCIKDMRDYVKRTFKDSKQDKEHYEECVEALDMIIKDCTEFTRNTSI